MKALRFKGGRHNYFGKRNSRSQRQQSKLYKGLKKIDTTLFFKQIENENKTTARSLHNKKQHA